MMAFSQVLTKMNQSQGVSNGKKYLKERKQKFGEISDSHEEEEEWQCQECEEIWGDESGVDGSFATTAVQSSTFSDQVYDI